MISSIAAVISLCSILRKKTNKLEQDMRSEGPCQLAGRVDGVSERPVEGGEATQSPFELTSAPMINICFFV